MNLALFVCVNSQTQKKKIATEDELPPLQPVFSPTQPSAENNQQLNQRAPAVNITGVSAAIGTKDVAADSRPQRSNRPVSISINSSRQKTASQPTIEANNNPEVNAEATDSHYTPSDFENAWKDFARRIPEIISAVSYIQTTLPIKTGEHSYELVFNNVLQENEFKKLLTDLSQFIRRELKNSAISFSSRVTEASGVARSNNPEEILRKMTEENPVLEKLKNNLKLEID